MWEGDTTNVKTGKYLIKDNLTPREVLAILIAGVKEVTARSRSPRARTCSSTSSCSTRRRSRPRRTSRRSRATRTSSRSTRSPGTRVDGYLFPDTYQFRVGEKPPTVLERLVLRHQEVWNELVAKHPRDAATLKDKLEWSDRDILTMASIVEKEAVDPAERPRIAQVFINRLTFAELQAAPARDRSDDPLRLQVPVQK